MKVEAKQEQLKSVVENDTETLELNLGIKVTSAVGEEGQYPAMRKAIAKSLGILKDSMTNTRKLAPAECDILVEMIGDPNGKPFKTSRLTMGKEIPGFEWSAKKDEDE